MNTNDLVPGCFPCDQQARVALSPREDVVHTDHWRVAHAFNSTLPGWLVLLVFAYLTDDQAQWLPATERDSIALSVRTALA